MSICFQVYRNDRRKSKKKMDARQIVIIILGIIRANKYHEPIILHNHIQSGVYMRLSMVANPPDLNSLKTIIVEFI